MEKINNVVYDYNETIRKYNSWLSEIKNDPKRTDEFRKAFIEIASKIFKEQCEEIRKYKTLLYLSSFMFSTRAPENGIYYFYTEITENEPYINHFNSIIFGWMENVKIVILSSNEIKSIKGKTS